ncbi:MAG: polysaccharide biosynthesis/export family protein [Xanthobacteraceae bacterium]
MRPGRLIVLLMLALAASGCMRTAAPPNVAVASVAAHAPRDLDHQAYARRRAPMVAAPVIAAPVVAAPIAAVPVAGVAPAPVVAVPAEPPYTLDTGDKLRITVFGQEGLTNSYFVDATGNVTIPLIGPVRARGLTTLQLSRTIAARLRRGFIREPHVAIEVEVYRPFFILGEVTAPGQYPYVPNMTVETAVAIAGGYTPRAYRWDVKIDRPEGGMLRSRNSVPLLTRLRPGDTIIVKERWF